jgi:hypothetical protein
MSTLAFGKGRGPNPLAGIWSALARPKSLPDLRDMKLGVGASARPAWQTEKGSIPHPTPKRVQLFRRSVRLYL